MIPGGKTADNKIIGGKKTNNVIADGRIRANNKRTNSVIISNIKIFREEKPLTRCLNLP